MGFRRKLKSLLRRMLCSADKEPFPRTVSSRPPTPYPHPVRRQQVSWDPRPNIEVIRPRPQPSGDSSAHSNEVVVRRRPYPMNRNTAVVIHHPPSSSSSGSSDDSIQTESEFTGISRRVPHDRPVRTASGKADQLRLLIAPPPPKPDRLDVAELTNTLNTFDKYMSHARYAVTGGAALAVWGYHGWQPKHVSIVCPPGDFEVIRSWAATAGCHLYRDRPDVLGLPVLPSWYAIAGPPPGGVKPDIREIKVKPLESDYQFDCLHKVIPAGLDVKYKGWLGATVQTKAVVLSLTSLLDQYSLAYVRVTTQPPTADVAVSRERIKHAGNIGGLICWILNRMNDAGWKETVPPRSAERLTAANVPHVVDEKFWIPFIRKYPESIKLFAEAGLNDPTPTQNAILRRPSFYKDGEGDQDVWMTASDKDSSDEGRLGLPKSRTHTDKTVKHKIPRKPVPLRITNTENENIKLSLPLPQTLYPHRTHNAMPPSDSGYATGNTETCVSAADEENNREGHSEEAEDFLEMPSRQTRPGTSRPYTSTTGVRNFRMSSEESVLLTPSTADPDPGGDILERIEKAMEERGPSPPWRF